PVAFWLLLVCRASPSKIITYVYLNLSALKLLATAYKLHMYASIVVGIAMRKLGKKEKSKSG
ncbi:MAG: hypothetical protein ACP5KE_09050, partial [Candidatus Methanodesulfokora sp.]